MWSSGLYVNKLELTELNKALVKPIPFLSDTIVSSFLDTYLILTFFMYDNTDFFSVIISNIMKYHLFGILRNRYDSLPVPG